jgi:tRNA-guanine transglycosylase
MNFDGIAIGGESVGYNMEITKEILEWIMPLIPEEKPHYTMGVGYSPTDLFDVVEQGIDMFDCVAPTRVARNGTLYTSEHRQKKKYTLNIINAKFRDDMSPIDPSCTCHTCTHYSRAYLHHLFKAQEMLAYRLATIHNLHFLLELMREMRTAIREDRFLELKKQWM